MGHPHHLPSDAIGFLFVTVGWRTYPMTRLRSLLDGLKDRDTDENGVVAKGLSCRNRLPGIAWCG